MGSEREQIRPHEPRIATTDLTGVGGSIGKSPEDFTVDEIALFEPSGTGDHWYVRIKKRLLTTQELLSLVARAAHANEREIGSAGMKDKHAVTTQWISVPTAGLPPERWELPADVEILEVSRNAKKLKTGQQRGNRFRIRLVDVGAEALSHAEAIMGSIEQTGLPNYFGAQRFGYGGQNLARALGWLERGAISAGKNARFLRKLYPSVIQSELFNRYVTERMDMTESLLSGDVVRLDGSSAVFVVESAERELPRLHTGDIHVTGPIYGPKMKQPAGYPLELETRVVSELGLSEREIVRLGELAQGSRRDLRVRPQDWDVDRLDRNSLLLQFTLPSGSYATQVVRELTRVPFGTGRTFEPD